VNSDIEIWKEITGYEQRYQVSSLGSVRNSSGYILATFPNKQGYRRVSLCKNNKRSNPYVATLVTESFIGKRPDGKQINHKNFNLLDNSVGNLEWVTAQENITHQRMSGRKIARQKLTDHNIKHIRLAHRCFGMTQTHLGKWFVVDQSTVSDIIRGKQWKHLMGKGAL
jgi:NUMOD4 motif/HNH endonuclease